MPVRSEGPLAGTEKSRSRTASFLSEPPGSVHALHRCPGHRLPMEPLAEVELDDAGLAGDAHRARGSIRHVLVQDEEVCRDLDLAPGEVKENVTLTGVGANSLPYGTRIEIGDAVLELTKECTPCSRMEEIRSGLREQLQGRRGVYARVVTPGTVRVGDRVIVQNRGVRGGSSPEEDSLVPAGSERTLRSTRGVRGGSSPEEDSLVPAGSERTLRSTQ